LAERGLGERVRLAGSRHDIPAVFGAADLLLSTSDSEGLPNVVLEAMAAALPIVATDVGGTREALGETGRLCPAGDVDGLADALLALLGDRAAREDLGRRAQERVEREFPMERMIRETEATYSECLERRRHPGRVAGR
jgi:glycosyltransferase involved in cell wall biosynthesis